MTINQDELIKQIADKEDINVATVRNVFRSAENIIFDYLSSTAPSEKMTIKPLNGLSIERIYIPEMIYTKGMFRDLICPEHIKAKASYSRYYSEKVNNRLLDRKMLAGRE